MVNNLPNLSHATFLKVTGLVLLTQPVKLISRQSSSSSHCGSVADEPDTRSSPGASQRYDENPDTSTQHPIKNNGYERSASANDEMMDRMPNEQGAEGLFPLIISCS